ncbi:uncharacterized protein LOC107575046, partial [Tachysurus ichikawai]
MDASENKDPDQQLEAPHNGTEEEELHRSEKDLKAARARLQAYDKEMTQEGSIYSSDSNVGEHDVDVLVPLPMQRPTDITATFSPTTSDISYLARAMQDSITLNRLPATEPPVFNGDPIQFIEWKSAFVSLIGGKAIPSADKLRYLK